MTWTVAPAERIRRTAGPSDKLTTVNVKALLGQSFNEVLDVHLRATAGAAGHELGNHDPTVAVHPRVTNNL